MIYISYLCPNGTGSHAGLCNIELFVNNMINSTIQDNSNFLAIKVREALF